jgi:predicted membrane-bound mannosyltransferase
MRLPHSPVNWRQRHWNLFGAALVLLWIFALGVRLPNLDERPMHTDEAVQADKAVKLWTTGKYVYDPEEYHGPSLYYFTIPILQLSGAQNYAQVNEKEFRLVPVLVGAALVLLLLLTIDGLGPWASVWAALLLSISPMMVFYSRYYIQEMLLVFLTYLFVAAAWRYTRGAPKAWAILAGAALGLMHATKETWVLSVAAMATAFLLTALWAHWMDKVPLNWRPHWKPHLKLRGVAIGAVLAVILFSSLGSNPRGPLDSLRAYAIYLNRGGGQGEGGSSGGSDSDHVHPTGYYVGRFLWTKYDYKRKEILFTDMMKQPALFKKPSVGPAWSEALIFALALCGFVAALARRGVGRGHLAFVRFLAFYTVILAVIYEIIPYKTPWCALGFWHTAILLAGFGTVAVVRALKPMPLKIIAVALLALGTLQLGKQSMAANFGRFVADERNPWVYAHTSADIFNLRDRAEGLAQVSPLGYAMPVMVITPDPWPLPWYFRKFEKTGFFPDVPPNLKAGSPQFVVAAQELQDGVAKQLPGWQQEIFGQRPRVFLVGNTEPELWKAFIETKK